MLPSALVALAYLVGSIPFSYLVVKVMAGKDVRELGSGNVGATNAARAGGKGAGILALLLDIAKGWLVIAIARWLVQQPGWPFEAGPMPWESREAWVAFAGFVGVVAHMFPVWLRFHGGKGVATAAGVFLGLNPIVLLGGMIVFAIVLLASRFVSLASIATAAAIPLLFRFLVNDAPFWHIVMSIAIAIAVITKHHGNIARLAHGRERRLGQGEGKDDE